MRKALRIAVLLGAFVLLIAVPAGAASHIGAAGHNLRSDPVYVDPAASPSITDEQADQLREIIKNGDHPLFIAVLPVSVRTEVHNNPNLLPKAVGTTTGLSGTYAVVAGPVFRAASSKSANFSGAGRLASESYQAHRSQGAFAVLKDFATKVEKKPAHHTSVWLLIGIALLVLLIIGGVIWLIRRKQQFYSQKQGLQQEIDTLQGEVDELIVNNDESVSNPASRANVTLTSAAKNLRGASNRYQLDNVEQQLDTAREQIAEAESHIHEDKENAMWPFDRTKKRDDRVPPRRRSSTSSTHNARAEAEEAARSRRPATNAPRGPVAEHDRPQPTVIINNTPPGYNGTGFGYYPMYGGYGYWDPYGSFVTDMLMLDLAMDAFDRNDYDVDQTVVNNYYGDDAGQGDTDSSDYTDENVGGGGDWSNDQGDTSSGEDFSGADQSDDSTGGGGDWSGSNDTPSYTDTPSYDAPAPDYGGDTGGSDWGGGGGGSDFGGGGGDFGGGGGDFGGGGGGDF